VRNNGLVGDVPSFTILSSRCTHVGMPDRAQRADAAAPAGADERGRGRARSDAAGGVRLSLSRQPVRHRGQPDGRPCAAGTRPLPILDPERPLGARPALQRRPRPRNRCGSQDPVLPPEGSRPACHWAGVVALPLRSAVMGIYELDSYTGGLG
jgi:hypothetical protein